MFLLACQLKSLAPAYSKVKRLTCVYFKSIGTEALGSHVAQLLQSSEVKE